MEANILHTHKELVEKCKSGDRNSQYQLYGLYIDAMFNVSMRLLGVREDAEDVVQDSFVLAFKHLHTFKYESTFGSWLKRIVINKSINHLKAKKVSFISIDTQQHQTIEHNTETIDINDIKKIKTAIKMLPNGYKQIINLYLIEGYDHIEISQVLGISNATSKSQYHRAKKKLIQIINTL